LGACQQHQPAPPPTTSILYSAMLRGLLHGAVPFVSVAQLRQQPTPVLLDTREAPEFAVSHLRGARLVGYDNFSLATVRDLPQSTPIVVYCSVGARSEKIGAQLKQAGFTNVRNLYGGIFEWVNEGQPVYTTANQPTTQVHAYAPSWGVWLQRGQKVYR
jgi:rhodanese-related sulfurtransferase